MAGEAEATTSSFLVTIIALLVTSAVTFLCLWLGKSWFVFFRGMYIGRKGRRRIQREAGIGIDAPVAVEQVGLVP